MKMSQILFNKISELMQVYILNPIVIEHYETGKFPRSEKVNDLNMRFRWDIFHGIVNQIPKNFRDELNELLDEHIDTAPRKICPIVTKKY